MTYQNNKADRSDQTQGHNDSFDTIRGLINITIYRT